MYRVIFFLLALLRLLGDAIATNLDGEAWLGQKRKQTDDVLQVVSELPSGLLYRVKDPGTGNFHPASDTYCNVDYAITLIDGSPVESTREQDQAAMLRPEDSIPAIQEALQLMVDGAWWELYVPSHLGYDARRNKDIRDGEALMVSLGLNSVLQGDKIPLGEVHNCLVQLDDDQARGYFKVRTSEACDDRDKDYIDKIISWEHRSSHIREELARLRSLLKKSDNDMNENLSMWARRRIHLLKQFTREDMRMCTIRHVPNGETEAVQPTDCNFKEQEYIHKVQDWELHKIQDEINRLAMYVEKSSMEAELASWVRKRVRILNQISRAMPVAKDKEEDHRESKEEL
jgi:hypothetical protein